MTTVIPHGGSDEIQRLGEELFERNVRPILRPEDDGKFIAIDVGSGEYEIDADDYSAVTRLRVRRPSGRLWLMMAGRATAYRFAGAR